jgi:hypothetical protein
MQTPPPIQLAYTLSQSPDFLTIEMVFRSGLAADMADTVVMLAVR